MCREPILSSWVVSQSAGSLALNTDDSSSVCSGTGADEGQTTRRISSRLKKPTQIFGVLKADSTGLPVKEAEVNHVDSSLKERSGTEGNHEVSDD